MLNVIGVPGYRPTARNVCSRMCSGRVRAMTWVTGVVVVATGCKAPIASNVQPGPVFGTAKSRGGVNTTVPGGLPTGWARTELNWPTTPATACRSAAMASNNRLKPRGPPAVMRSTLLTHGSNVNVELNRASVTGRPFSRDGAGELELEEVDGGEVSGAEVDAVGGDEVAERVEIDHGVGRGDGHDRVVVVREEAHEGRRDHDRSRRRGGQAHRQ